MESNPHWVDEFVRLAIPLRKSLGELAVAVEHVGSTAVPGLVAKPILDLAIGLAADADAGEVTAPMPVAEPNHMSVGDPVRRAILQDEQ